MKIFGTIIVVVTFVIFILTIWTVKNQI